MLMLMSTSIFLWNTGPPMYSFQSLETRRHPSWSCKYKTKIENQPSPRNTKLKLANDLSLAISQVGPKLLLIWGHYIIMVQVTPKKGK